MLGKENSPNFSAIWKRINKINLEDDNGRSWFSDGKVKTGIVVLAGGSAGLEPTSRVDWTGEKWNVKRGFIKLHIMVDSKTKKTCAVSAADNSCGDAPEFKKLLDEALQNIENSPNVISSEELSVDADGAYGPDDNFKECDKQNATPIISVRKNFSIKTKGSKSRKEQGLLQLGNC